ncbi:hypothetical protein lbkm_0671 [Lachnospiraceae bacterium KM106-2]|nr:hypothetical protein lbkm_0671 [Lachnospiraceae bacterium KM106-2]
MKGKYYSRVNVSQKQKKIKKRLEELGNTDVEVWWEKLEHAVEMGGMGGGFFFCSNEYSLEPIGYSFDEAMEYIELFDSKNGDIEKINY